MYENSRFLKNRFTFCGVNTNFGQQWTPPAHYHLTPIVSMGKHCYGCHPHWQVRYVTTNWIGNAIELFVLYGYEAHAVALRPADSSSHHIGICLQ